MRVWVVVPFSRAPNQGKVWCNFDRQEHQDKKLVVVKNGSAVDHWYQPDDFSGGAELILESEAHQSAARNTALDALREREDDPYVVFMDDDDYYGPGYLSEHVKLAKKGRIVGKYAHWVHFECKCFALFRPEMANKNLPWVKAGTIGGFAKEMPNFPIQSVGEEQAMCEIFRKQGGEVLSSSIYHHLYFRSRDPLKHAFQATDAAFVKIHGPWFYKYPEGSYGLVNGRMLPTAPRCTANGLNC